MKGNPAIFLFLIIFFALYLRLPQILKDEFPFVFDMGRDMLWVRDIVVLHRPYLIGPWGSIAGIFFGPAWYYFLSTPFFITGGDPRGSVILVLFFNLATIITAFFLGKRIKNETLGVVFASLMASSSLMINVSTYAFHANLLPLITIFFIWSLYEVVEGKEQYLILASFLTSLSFHFEPATAIFTTLTLLTFVIWQRGILRRIKIVFTSAIGFVFPFVPQLIFETRHNFIQTRALVAYFKGENESLGGKLPLIERFINRTEKFLGLFSSSVFSFNNKWVGVLFFLFTGLVVFLIYRSASKKIKNFIKINLLVLLIPFFGYIFLFPPELKGWYLYGFAIPYILLVGLVIFNLWRKKLLVGFSLLCFLIFTNGGLDSKISSLINPKERYEGPEILADQKRVVDFVYQDTSVLPFSVYVFTPPIYDYHYQYLFWWQGGKRGYWPEEYAYLPDKVDYVPHKEEYIRRQREIQPFREPEFVYLIIEPGDKNQIQGWLGHFAKYQLVKEDKLETGVIIQKRSGQT